MVIKVVRAFSRCANPVVICNMLLDRGECHETRNIRGLGNPATGTPTTEAEPPCVLVISVGIVHELWAFVRSEEPVVRGGVTTFVIESFPPAICSECIDLVKDTPVEP